MTALIEAADGPLDPPSSRPRAGVLGGEVFGYRFSPREGAQRVALPVATPHRDAVTPATVLHWAFYADDTAALAEPWASLAVCPDVVFDDGSRLSDGLRDAVGTVPAIDRYGHAVLPEAQFAARWSLPEQWNADTVSLAPWAGRRIAHVEVVLGDPALHDAAPGTLPPEAAGFVEVRVAEHAPGVPDSPAERVDTRRGSHAGPRLSRGNTVPATAVPHGFNLVVSATDAGETRWPYRPFVHDDAEGRRLEAIQLSHQPSPWIGDHGVLQFMPFQGEGRSDRAARRRHIRPDGEEARPHRYAAGLVGGLDVEATATDRAVAVRVHGAGAVGLVIDQPDDRGRLHVEPGDDGRVRVHGWVAERADAVWGNAPRMYFAGETDRPCAVARLDDAGRGRVAASVTAGGAVELRVATSFLSVAQARRSLAREAPWSTTFDALVADARRRWDAVCGAIEVPAPEDPRLALAHEELCATIAGDLYRLHLYPSDAAEDTGEPGAPDWRYADVFAPPRPHGETETGAPVARGRLVVGNGYWDTYRTVWPLLALLDPDGTGRLLDGQLEQVRRGGWTARWSAPGYVDCMVGTSSDQIHADAAAWGVPGVDLELAFEAGWRNACEPSDDPRTGRAGVASSRFRGFVSRDVQEGLSWTIEGAIGDAGLARLADRLARRAAAPEASARYRAFARYLANRALAYRSLFDAGTGFFRGRERDGALPPGPFDPRAWGGDYTETNAWGMSVSAVHDGAGLAELYGGPAALRAHLDRLFAEPETAEHAGAYGGVIHEQREARAMRSGMCALSNQPAHHIPFMHRHGDEPWRAGSTAHALAARLFAGGHIAQGYPGDEDNGELSAWWLWALLGLYPLDPATGVLAIGSPLVDDVTVRRADGRSLRIRARRDTPAARYLIEARLNGAPLGRAELPVAAFAHDGDLELVLSETPPVDAAIWRASRTPAAPWRPDLSRPAHAIASEGVAAGSLFDDGAAALPVPLGRDGWVGQAFPEPRRVSDVTVTAAAAAGAASFEVERSEDGAAWLPVATTHREPLRTDRTTPFALSAPVVARFWRVRANEPLALLQLELFDLVEPAPATGRGDAR